ncbi:hypothetical protein AAK899_09580 [Erysipelotrichaceae bacterium 51-3]|uniref:hypothetical protein n=1 Tax=Allobaculum sp. JKK-2023 TaxID=3108943 RepID=UPI002B05DC1A|nr:hypothetical protein [Allobaculum sp. JKK-2023]
MKALEKVLKVLAAFAAIAAACYAIYRLIEKHNAKMDELDAYLMDNEADEDTEDEVPTAYPAGDEEYLDQDLGEWNELDDDAAVTLSFLVDPSKAEEFQKALADAGYSSTYENDTKVLDAMIRGPKDRKEIEEFDELLKSLLVSTNSTYLGFAFE